MRDTRLRARVALLAFAGSLLVGLAGAPACAAESTGTASIRMTAPRMDTTGSPFDLAFGSPSAYPATLVAGGQAVVAITPKRQSYAGVQHDDIVWSTDVANMTTVRNMVSATFVDDGGACAASGIFGLLARSV